MSHIIAVRHGEDRDSIASFGRKVLMPKGVDQMNGIAEYVALLETRFRIVSSDKVHSRQSAEIIGDVLGCSSVPDERLRLDKIYTLKDLEEIDSCHRSGDSSVIYVGHEDFLRDFSRYVAEQLVKVPVYDGFAKGEGFHANLSRGIISRVPLVG